VDDEDRENEGDLAMAADMVTPEAVNFMARYGRGLICVSLTEDRVARLGLPMMAVDNRSPRMTAFTVSVDARVGTTTGISARERCDTIRATVAADARPEDLITPGHIFPLRARPGGVLVRSGHTEGSVDLARLAGREPAGVICEIMRDDGEMARIPDLIPFCAEHKLRILTVAELIRYRLRNERYIVRAGETRIQTKYGEFRMIAYESEVNGGESHIALVRGDLCPSCPACTEGSANVPGDPRTSRPPCSHPVLVRVHTRCTAGDVFAADCKCREVLDQSMRMIAEEGCGAILYLHNTSRGFDIDKEAVTNSPFEIAGMPPGSGAAALADRLILHQELRTREGSQARTGRILRAIGLGGQILSDLGIQRIRLLSNTPMHIPALEGFGLEIVEQVPIPVEECSRV